jgi:hypothetical protein
MLGQSAEAERHDPAHRTGQVEADDGKSRWVLIDLTVRNQKRWHRQGPERL